MFQKFNGLNKRFEKNREKQRFNLFLAMGAVYKL